MDRATFLKHLAWTSAAPLALAACGRSRSRPAPDTAVADTINVHQLRADIPPIDKSPDEWKALLSDDVYHILFEAGTEPRHSSPLLDEKRTGTYICAACRLPLFSSKTKFESGTGWPSFWAPLEGRIETKKDTKLGYPRTEYHCVRCKGHQGHVFEDGPEPTGLRYCNNGLALTFVPAEKSLPPLRT
ncbi:MAG: peptide-methionine (R)-S-oxide reductase MsrB [Salinibacter sp.]